MLHTLVVYVDDKPGVLNRVASLFRRRAFNIDSLTVGHTETPGVSRMTIVCDVDPLNARRVEANIYKLVDVLRVDDITEQPSVERELAMIKVAATAGDPRADHPARRRLPRARRGRLGRLADRRDHRQRRQDRAAADVLKPYGVLEMVRTGRVAMARGPRPAERLADQFAGEDAQRRSGRFVTLSEPVAAAAARSSGARSLRSP